MIDFDDLDSWKPAPRASGELDFSDLDSFRPSARNAMAQERAKRDGVIPFPSKSLPGAGTAMDSDEDARKRGSADRLAKQIAEDEKKDRMQREFDAGATADSAVAAVQRSIGGGIRMAGEFAAPVVGLLDAAKNPEAFVRSAYDRGQNPQAALIQSGMDNTLANTGAGIAESARITQQELAPRMLSRPDSIVDDPLQALKYYGQQGAVNAPNLLLSTGAALSTGPAGALAMAGGLAGGAKFADARDEGQDFTSAARGAGITALTEGVPEMLPAAAALGKLSRFLPKSIAENIVGRVAATATAEGATETITEAANAAYEVYGEGKTITRDQFVNRVKDAFLTGSVAGAAVGGVMGTGEYTQARTPSGSRIASNGETLSGAIDFTPDRAREITARILPADPDTAAGADLVSKAMRSAGVGDEQTRLDALLAGVESGRQEVGDARRSVDRVSDPVGAADRVPVVPEVAGGPQDVQVPTSGRPAQENDDVRTVGTRIADLPDGSFLAFGDPADLRARLTAAGVDVYGLPRMVNGEPAVRFPKAARAQIEGVLGAKSGAGTGQETYSADPLQGASGGVRNNADDAGIAAGRELLDSSGQQDSRNNALGTTGQSATDDQHNQSARGGSQLPIGGQNTPSAIGPVVLQQPQVSGSRAPAPIAQPTQAEASVGGRVDSARPIPGVLLPELSARDGRGREAIPRPDSGSGRGIDGGTQALPNLPTASEQAVGGRYEIPLDQAVSNDRKPAQAPVGDRQGDGGRMDADSASVQPMARSNRFPEDNRLSSLSQTGPSWQRIRERNPALRGKGVDDEITIYRATIGGEIRPDDFVAVDKSTLRTELANVRARDGKAAKIVEQKVRVRDLLMGNDATEFVYFPDQAPQQDSPRAPPSAGLGVSGTGESSVQSPNARSEEGGDGVGDRHEPGSNAGTSSGAQAPRAGDPGSVPQGASGQGGTSVRAAPDSDAGRLREVLDGGVSENDGALSATDAQAEGVSDAGSRDPASEDRRNQRAESSRAEGSDSESSAEGRPAGVSAAGPDGSRSRSGGTDAVSAHSGGRDEAVPAVERAALTAADARAEITAALGAKFLRRVDERDWFHLVETPADIPAKVRAKLEGPDSAAGFVLDGQVYVVASNLDQGNAPGVLLHELGVHFGMSGILGDDFRLVLGKFRKLKGKDSRVDEAYATVPEDTDASLIDEEALAYFVEANWSGEDLRGIVAKVKDAIKSLLNRLGIPLSTLNASPEMLVKVAKGAASRAAKGEVGGKASGARMSFAGRNAKTANIGTQAQAEEMLADGAGAEAVRKATGWHKGRDGKWRFEIDDSGARLKADRGAMTVDLQQSGGNEYATVMLPELLDHPALLDAYPELANVSVTLKGYSSGQGRASIRGDAEIGFFIAVNSAYRKPATAMAYGEPFPVTQEQADEINREQSALGNIRLNDPKELLSVLLHEIQHGIQDVEGFAKGGNSAEFNDRDVTEQESKPLDRKLNELLESDPTFGRLRREHNRDWARIDSKYGTDSPRGRRLDWEDVPTDERESYFARMDELEKFPQQWEYMSAEHERQMLHKNRVIESGHEQYRRLAGETEARNTQARQKLTADERREKSPQSTQDVEDEKQIVRYSRRAESRKGGEGGSVGGVKSGPASVAEQADDSYMMQHRPPSPGTYGDVLHNLNVNTFDDEIYTANAAQYFGTGDARLDRKAVALFKQVRGKPDALVTVYRAAPKGLAGAQIRPGDWVTPLKEYAAIHGEGPLNGDYQVIERTVKASELYTSSDSILEAGWHPPGASQDNRQAPPSEGLGASGPAYSRAGAVAKARTAAQKAALTKAGMPEETRSLVQRGKEYVKAQWGAVLAKVTDGPKQRIFDRFHRMSAIEQDLGIPAERSAYLSARLSAGLPSIMEGLMSYGAPVWDGGVLTQKEGTVGLLEALRPVADDINGWLGWMVGRRAKALKAQGRENLMSDEDITALLSLAEGREAEFTKSALAYLEIKNAVLDVAEKAGLIDPVSRKTWDSVEYIPFYRQEETDEDALTPGTRQSLVKGPGKGRSLSGQSSGIKQLKGGTQNLADPLGNIVRNFTKLIDASLKNNAMLEAVDGYGDAFFEPVGMGGGFERVALSQVKAVLLERGVPQSVIDSMPAGTLSGLTKMWAVKPPADEDVVRVMRNGRPEYYRVPDKDLLLSLTAFKVPATHWAVSPFKFAKRLLTVGVTVSPDFMVRNFLRDSGSAWVMTDDKFTFGWASVKGIISPLIDNAHQRDMMFAGGSFIGGQFYNVGSDVETSKAVRRALRERGLTEGGVNNFLQTIVTTPVGLWDRWQKVGSYVENANRNAVYEAALKAGRSKKEASYLARDLMDFSMHGDSRFIQYLADVLPFFNARLQGLYKLYRQGGKRKLRKALLMRAGTIVAGTLGLLAWNMLMYGDGYDELEEWDKDAYWHIAPGTSWHIRVPKPFELGVLFATIPERMARAAMYQIPGGSEGDRPDVTLKSMLAQVSGTLAMNPIPQLGIPPLELWANKSFFTGRPIENPGDEKLLPEARAEWYTSDSAKAISDVIGNTTGLSPKQIEHLWNGYTGTAGGYALDTVDWLVRTVANKPEHPELAWAEMPLIKALYRGDMVPKSTRYTTEFYELLNKTEATSNTIKEFIVNGREEDADALEAENKVMLGGQVKSKRAKAGFMHVNVQKLNKAQDAMADIRKEIEGIAMMPGLTDHQKRMKIEALNLERNNLARKIVREMRAAQ